MATQRNEQEFPFPLDGEQVLSTDGTTWLAHVVEGEPPRWEQGEPSLSVDELDRAQVQQRAVLDRLARDHRVWARAWGRCTRITVHGPDMRDTDPPEQWCEMLARAALSDSLAETCDGARLGLEDQAASQIRALLGDPEWATVSAMLEAFRRQDADEQAPTSLVARTRAPLAALGELAGKLDPDSDARKTITRITQGKGTAGDPDALFRQLCVAGVALEVAMGAHGAASEVVHASTPPAS